LATQPTNTYKPPDPLVGKLFDDRYEVVEKIGEGGMGAVYKARQLAMDRMVALKVIHPDQQADETVVKRFFREMKTTSRIAHPNTVSVYDFGKSEDGMFFLAMELLKGRSLADALDEGPLPVEQAVPIAAQIMKALSAAHAEHVIHRDLKPENIMLLEVYGEANQVRVLDFGIATFASSSEEAPSARVTASGIMVGTPSYVSPEQIGGEELDHRADLYSFGVLLYEMVTGILPFHDPERPLRVLQMHMTEIPKRPSVVAKQTIPSWLDDLIMQLLAKYPDDRPQSAEDVVRVLENPDGGPAPKNKTPGLAYRAAPPPAPPQRSGPPTAVIAVAVIAFGLLALIGGVGIGLFLSQM
jgi:serine/threonine protein kinase